MTHIVRRGDTLGTIAARYGTTVMAVMRANGIMNPNLLYEGQALRIPAPSTASGMATMQSTPSHLPMMPTTGGNLPGMSPTGTSGPGAPYMMPGTANLSNQYASTQPSEWSHSGLGPHGHHPHTQLLNRHEQRLDDLEARISNLEARLGQQGRYA